MPPAATSSIVGAIACLSSHPLGAHAQALKPGARVRVTYDCVISVSRDTRNEACQRVQGLVIARDSLGLTVARSPRGVPVLVSHRSITRVEISVGRRGNLTKGALLGGLLLGSVTAWGTDAILNAAYCDAPRCPHSAFALVWGFLPGLGIGAAIGQAVGAAVTSERWERVPRERLTPGTRLPDRWRLGWSFAF